MYFRSEAGEPFKGHREMFFIISKVVLFLLLPPSSLIIVMISGLLLIKRYPRVARGLIVGGLVLLYLLSIRPVSDRLLKPLESGFPSLKDASASSASTIVILTGGAVDLLWLGISPEPSRVSLSRLIYGITLYRQIPGAKFIISGGSGDPQKPDISEADAMKDMALALGIPAEDMLVERDSRNTLESAQALNRLLKEKKILLVTSAFHMRRSSAMFKKLGMDVIPAPTDYESEQKWGGLYDFIPKATSLLSSSTAIYEYMGLAWYGFAGNL